MLSLIFVALATFTNVQTGETVDMAGQVGSVTEYAEVINSARETEFTDEVGVQYVITAAHIVVIDPN